MVVEPWFLSWVFPTSKKKMQNIYDGKIDLNANGSHYKHYHQLEKIVYSSLFLLHFSKSY
jgi:hypothetical protein